MVKKAIYLASTEEASGKSVIAISLASIASELSKKVGYFKPITLENSLAPGREGIDEDIEVMRKILNLKLEYDSLCPITLKRDDFIKDFLGVNVSQYIKNLSKCFERVSEGRDIMLIEGPPTLSLGSFLECPVPRLAKHFNAEILLVLRFKDDFIVDEILETREYCARWNAKILGVVLNRVPRDFMHRVENVIKPFIEEYGLKVFGVIPEEKSLSALTAREICEFLGGRILAGEDGLDNLVEDVLIGAMTPESAAKYFRRAINEVVITGGDRTDVILTALETGVAALILTGNLYPSAKVFPRADQLRVPLILVPYDTYTTLLHVQKIIGRIKPNDYRRIKSAINLVREHVDWKQILEIES